MVIDIFGRGGSSTQKNISNRGRPGKDALELTKYFPNGIAAMIREHDMATSYVLESKNDCELKNRDRIMEVKDKCPEKPRLKLLSGSQPCELIQLNTFGTKKQYSMSFLGKSVYRLKVEKNNGNCGFFCNRPGTGFISLTLKVQKDRPQTLLYCTSTVASPPPPPLHPPILREITVTSHEICIWGELDSQIHSETIMFDLSKKFASFCLKWEIVKNQHEEQPTTPQTVSKTAYTYHIKNDTDHLSGHFSLDTIKAAPNDFYVGGRPDSRQLFTGEVHSLECYKTQENDIPQIILELITDSTFVKRAVASTTTRETVVIMSAASYSEEEEEEDIGGNNQQLVDEFSSCDDDDAAPPPVVVIEKKRPTTTATTKKQRSSPCTPAKKGNNSGKKRQQKKGGGGHHHYQHTTSSSEEDDEGRSPENRQTVKKRQQKPSKKRTHHHQHQEKKEDKKASSTSRPSSSKKKKLSPSKEEAVFQQQQERSVLTTPLSQPQMMTPLSSPQQQQPVPPSFISFPPLPPQTADQLSLIFNQIQSDISDIANHLRVGLVKSKKRVNLCDIAKKLDVLLNNIDHPNNSGPSHHNNNFTGDMVVDNSNELQLFNDPSVVATSAGQEANNTACLMVNNHPISAGALMANINTTSGSGALINSTTFPSPLNPSLMQSNGDAAGMISTMDHHH